MKTFKEFLEEARELRNISTPHTSGTMSIPGSEGKARKDIAVAGFRGRGPVQDPKVTTDWKMKNGPDVATYVRTHRNPTAFASNIAKQAYKEGEKNVRSTVRGLQSQLSGVKGAVHDITVGTAKSKLSPTQKARAFLSALKGVGQKALEAGAKPGDVVVNKPTNISSSGPKRSRSDAEGAAQRGSIYQKIKGPSGEKMSPISSRTGYQTARVKGGGSSAQDVTDDPNSKPIAARLKNYKVGGSQGYGISGIKLADSYDPYK